MSRAILVSPKGDLLDRRCHKPWKKFAKRGYAGLHEYIGLGNFLLWTKANPRDPFESQMLTHSKISLCTIEIIIT